MNPLIDILSRELADICEITASESARDSKLLNTEGFESTISIIATPSDKQAIQKILHIANSPDVYDVPAFSIYPVGTGKNWGYGSGLPSNQNATVVLLDLSKLNDITYFDSENGIVTLEPGVTQQQLFDFLTEQNAPFMVPVTGAGPSAGIVSNALERGYGITPTADHFTAVTNLKGYLADGSFYESSLKVMSDEAGGDETNCYVDKTFKWKHGPYLDGIFTQSGNMIVTEMTIALARIKPAFDSFYMRFYEKESFETAYSVVKEIFNNLEGVVGSINLMDKRRICSMVAENPQGAQSHSVMTEHQVEAIAKQYDVPEWTVVGTIYGTNNVAKAAKRDIRKIAKGKANQILFSSSLLVKIGQLATKLLPFSALDNARIQLEKLEKGMEVMRGKPSQVALPLAYWRNPRVKPGVQSKLLHPAKDSCGLLWYAPLVPARAPDMSKFIEMIRRITPKYNIEPMITFTNLSGISTDSTIPIVFDRENPQAIKDAQACLNELVCEGLKRGFIPYRLNIEQQKSLNATSTYWKAAGKIAAALDPNGIISPDRYNPYKPQ
jgi:FAD/FMN-containing dehydrogenase